MINRREFFGISAGAGAALALTPELLRAFQQPSGQLIRRAIPSSGEMLPVVSFSPQAASESAGMKEILTALLDNGGKVVDVMHGGGEQVARTAARELGIQNRFFWTTDAHVPLLPGYAGPPVKLDPSAVRAAVDEKLARMKVPSVDLFMVYADPSIDISTTLAVLREMKKERRVRYIGVLTLASPPNAPSPPFGDLESIMRNEEPDLVATNYSVGDRRVEEKILPLALERRIGFMAYFPFDRARIFQRASTTPLPEWAAEFDARTWAQFCLKYVLSHPAVVVARTGTTRAHHMLDNIGGGIGRLPNEAMRKRMAEFVDALPPTPAPAPTVANVTRPQAAQAPAVVLSAAILDRYVGEYFYQAAGQTMTFRRDGERLLGKLPGEMPELPLVARSETRFTTGPMLIEFQLDGRGNVTGAVVETALDRVPLVRK
jgi:aryl-alcohol dehydrogenase-like predicted oxidoreductase